MRKRVLAIEDDADILSIIDAVLSDEGYEVISSANSEPLDYLDEINPDVILLDHFLGSSLGQVLCRELKEDPETRHIPVILISAASNLAGIAADCKANAFIAKPFDIDFLIETVRQSVTPQI